MTSPYEAFRGESRPSTVVIRPPVFAPLALGERRPAPSFPAEIGSTFLSSAMVAQESKRFDCVVIEGATLAEFEPRCMVAEAGVVMLTPLDLERNQLIARRLMDRASGFQCLAFQQGEAGGYAIFRRLGRRTRSGIARARLPASGAANQTAEAD